MNDSEQQALRLEPREHYDAAIIGQTRGDFAQPVLVYDEEKVILAAMRALDCDRDEAIDWCEFNVFGAYLGPGTPLYVTVEA